MIPNMIRIMRQMKFVTYDKPYQLNIIGERSNETNSNKFDDTLWVFYKDGYNKWQHYKFAITTDPGTYWLKNPSQVNGTAILKSGQYVDAYSFGLHKGQYKALVQTKKVNVLRDYDRNAVLDFFNGTEYSGMFGINIHHASFTGSSTEVGKWSAGCQVFQNIKDFTQFLTLCELHRKRYGNKFTYTLLDWRMIERASRRYAMYGIVTLAALGGITYWYLKD